MRIPLFAILPLTLLAALVATESAAQGVDVGVSGVGLLSIQPIDDAYVGGPYLNEGIGGLAPGVGVGIHAIFPAGFTIAAEYSRAYFEQEQDGRLVPGPRPSGPGGSSIGGSGTTRLRDSLLSGMVGYATGGTGTRAVFLAGAAAQLDDPVVAHADGESVVGGEESDLPFVITGGVDVLRPFSARVALIFSARYALIARSESQQYLGIGRHVIRAGIGVRLSVN